MKTFVPVETSDEVRDRLRTLQQKSSVAEYNAKFRHLSMQINMAFEEERYIYLQGLTPKIRDLVRTKDNLDDIRELQLACLRLDDRSNRREMSRGPNPREIDALTANTPSSRSTSTLETGDRRYGRMPSRGRGNTHGRGNLRGRMSNNSRRDRTIICYTCDEAGHFARHCPKRAEIREVLRPKANFAAGGDIVTVIDSGASQHMFKRLNAFRDYSPKRTKITCAGSSQDLKSTNVGTVDLDIGKGEIKTLHGVLHVPELRHNLVSVRELTKDGNDVVFSRDGAVQLVDDNNSQEIGRAVGGLYQLTSPSALVTELPASKVDEYTLWHHRLGHPCRETLLALPKHAIGLEKARLTPPPKRVCAGCAYGKSKRLPFGTASWRAEEVLGRVHSDLCGPLPTPSTGGARYILTFIDDATRYVVVYFLKQKSETHAKFMAYKTFHEKQTGKSLKILRSDGGGEYVNSDMKTFFEKHGIRHETTTPDTPEQNGVAERYNRTLLESVRHDAFCCRT